MARYTFIDLFAGIGGFHLAMHSLGVECVFASEIDKYARKTYEDNFHLVSPTIFENGMFAGDITRVEATDIPDHDILCAGFPCQPFSQAGLKAGFNETRGTLFFDIARIIDAKKPRVFFLENVSGIVSHNNGATIQTIKGTIADLGYSFYGKVMRGTDFNLPQPRPRFYMVGFKDTTAKFEFPTPIPLTKTMDDIFGGNVNRKIGYTLRVGGRGSGVGDRRNWDTYIVNGESRRLGIKEGLMMQGFPSDFRFSSSNTQSFKQIGNSVAVPVITAIGEQIIKSLDSQ